ncbi:MAG: MATE family efflux transporter [Coprococcus sp.]
MRRIRSDARTLAVIDVVIGVILGVALFVLRTPLLSMYQLTPDARILADHLIIVMSFVMVGISYQMPVSFGIIQGAGDTKFTMTMNMAIWRLRCRYHLRRLSGGNGHRSGQIAIQSDQI